VVEDGLELGADNAQPSAEVALGAGSNQANVGATRRAYCAERALSEAPRTLYSLVDKLRAGTVRVFVMHDYAPCCKGRA